MKLKTLTLAILIGLGVALALPINATEMPQGPHLSTTGIASVDVPPDMATIVIEVSSSAKDAAAAKRQVDMRITHYFDFLHKNGIENKDINAANLITQPEYDYQKSGTAVLKGYRAVRQVQVTLRQIDKLNVLLDGALKLNLNEIQSVRLGVANPTIYHEQALKKAIDNAIFQATSLADGFKVNLGPVYSIQYQMNNDQPPMPRPLFLRVGNASETNPAQTYEQQRIHFKEQVDVVFELKNR
ncbi:MAG: oxidative stress defense protein [Rickettsiella sp.]|nr:oxidative stress defense protein [Rickettsiella sp.]